MAGFTTVQSIGSPSDVDLRAAIARGVVPGPRLLTSIRPVNENTGTPDEIRAFVRKVKADGADLVKLFASKSSREGGAQTMTDEQIQAACGEAKAVGLRSLGPRAQPVVDSRRDARRVHGGDARQPGDRRRAAS